MGICYSWRTGGCILDSGVNFHDAKLRTVVIDSADYIEVKQMLGRKRAEEGEIVNVYIMTKSSKEKYGMLLNL